VSHQAKWGHFRANYERYQKAGRKLKHVILNEFCLSTGYNRRYPIRLLRNVGRQKSTRTFLTIGLSWQ
jgi:hypothetical protein